MSFRAAITGALATLALAACGGGEGSSGTASSGVPGVGTSCASGASCGSVYVAVTDADGDFLSYTVDVLSLSLERADGTTVQALPVSTRVDFSQYVDLSEFLTAATVPVGTYVGGTMRLDYTNADISVELNGQPQAARAVDASGTVLGVRDVRVVLDNRGRLVVTPGRPALLTLDFDLTASNSVNLGTTPITVTATPALVASIAPVDEKELRLRGPLVSVDTGAGSYVADVRPFNHPTARFGQVTVHTDSTTAFEINGQSYTGAAGLAALVAAGTGTPTIAFGTLTTAERRFDAAVVHAGSSVPGLSQDVVTGSILSRSGNELIVRGGTLITPSSTTDGSQFVRDAIKVRIGAGTRVFKDGLPAASLGLDALSVGQRIQAFGSVATENGQRVLDATQGRVRMHLTHLLGTVAGAVPGQLTMQLGAIDGREVSAFNFTGTGLTSAVDANPNAYEVATGQLPLSNLVAGHPVRVFGFVTPFGVAPPDFTGRTVADYSEVRSVLAIGWGTTGTAAPFLSLGSEGLLLDLANPAIGQRHTLRVGPFVRDLLALPAAPRIVPATGVRTSFVVVAQGTSRMYADFAEFVADLTLRLNGSTRLRGLTATGQYDGGLNQFTAQTAVVILD
ncbi:MAG: metallophosphoesterase [Steroidobacteraceae bacterium]